MSTKGINTVAVHLGCRSALTQAALETIEIYLNGSSFFVLGMAATKIPHDCGSCLSLTAYWLGQHQKFLIFRDASDIPRLIHFISCKRDQILNTIKLQFNAPFLHLILNSSGLFENVMWYDRVKNLLIAEVGEEAFEKELNEMLKE
jgi:hypothetical protein